MSKPFIIAFLAAFALGFVLVNPWALVYYLLVLVVATIAALFVVFFSLKRRHKHWKVALLCLAVVYTPALTAYGIQTYMNFRDLTKRKNLINALYIYRDKYGHFPQAITELSSGISILRTNYIPDSNLKNFTLSTRDIYGMPWTFRSKDSTWGR